jgi:hypothetical protein
MEPPRNRMGPQPRHERSFLAYSYLKSRRNKLHPFEKIRGGGSLVTTISLRFGKADIDTNNSAPLFSRKLSWGQHIIKLSPTGSGDGGPNKNLIQIDQFVAFP